MKRVPLRLEGGGVVGSAVIDEETGKIAAHVTDPVAAAQLAATLTDSAGSFSIAGAPDPRKPPRPEDRPSHEQAVSNQLRGTCGGSRWRYVGGDCLGWWETCKGCSACA